MKTHPVGLKGLGAVLLPLLEAVAALSLVEDVGRKLSAFGRPGHGSHGSRTHSKTMASDTGSDTGCESTWPARGSLGRQRDHLPDAGGPQVCKVSGTQHSAAAAIAALTHDQMQISAAAVHFAGWQSRTHLCFRVAATAAYPLLPTTTTMQCTFAVCALARLQRFIITRWSAASFLATAPPLG